MASAQGNTEIKCHSINKHFACKIHGEFDLYNHSRPISIHATRLFGLPFFRAEQTRFNTGKYKIVINNTASNDIKISALPKHVTYATYKPITTLRKGNESDYSAIPYRCLCVWGAFAKRGVLSRLSEVH
jgi:hypothetical protein